MGADLVGKVLGDFHVEALVGQGSMARVYQARQVSLRRNVALKILEEGIFTPHDNIKRFLREAEAMARMEHAHIVPVYTAGEEPPYYFFAMRLIRGGNLAAAMRAGAPKGMIVRWAYEVCMALAYAHKQGIIHRDLKPTNVLIQDGVALLGDFGLARLREWSTITHSGRLLGTPLYMAPEQTLVQPITAATDCFALGVILYEMLLGKHPFADRKTSGQSRIQMCAELFDRIQKCQCTPPREVDPQLSPALERVITRALTPTIETRYPDAMAMLKDMEEAYRQLPDTERVIQTEVAVCNIPVQLPIKSGESTSTANAIPPANTQVFGRYQVLREIGHGGQGVVYQAHDPVLERDVALKVLQKTNNQTERVERLFKHEARVAAKLTHPHIIPIYDFGVVDRAPFLTMQLIDGLSLDRFLAKRQPLPLAFAVHVLIQTAEALAYAHDTGVIHLDVKPGNILIQRVSKHVPEIAESLGDLGFPHVLLTDFTMATVRQAHATVVDAPPDMTASPSQRLRNAGLTAATIPYASPEQLDNNIEALGPASDIFSLGVVFHEMLTGRRLFDHTGMTATQILVLHRTVPLPSARNPKVPPGADQLCMKMLQREIADRPKTAAEIVVAAHALLNKSGG